MEQALETSLQNAKSLSDTLKIALISWSIFSAIVLAVLGSWQYKVTKRIERLTSELTAQKENKNAAERLRIENEINTSKFKAAELQEKLKPRELNEQQKQIIISELKKIITSIDPIVVASKLMDDESISYGKQIHETIEKTGWITRFSPTSFHTFKGMSIFYHPNNKKSEYCEIVKAAFQKANVEFETTYYDIKSISLQANEVIYIVVGNK